MKRLRDFALVPRDFSRAVHASLDLLVPVDNIVSLIEEYTDSETIILTWLCTKKHHWVELPVIPSGTYNCIIDWGDGLLPTRMDGYKYSLHHYRAPEGLEEWTVTVLISGTFRGFSFGVSDCLVSNLISIHQAGSLRLGNVTSHFKGCEELVYIDPNLSIGDVSDMTDMFAHAAAFNCPSVSQWDTAHVTRMVNTFTGASKFNQPLCQWNTSRVMDMNGMFENAEEFNQPLSCWDVSQVTSMCEMFNGAINFNQPLATWNTIRVKDMSFMFYYALSFNSSPPLKLRGVHFIEYMFSHAATFNQSLDMWDTSTVKNASGLFECSFRFNQPLHTWNVSGIDTMCNMFFGARAFKQSLLSWDMTHHPVATNMFGDEDSGPVTHRPRYIPNMDRR